MPTDQPPPPGSMYLWDAITPPLPAGSYRLSTTAEAELGGGLGTQTVADDRYFTIDAPRFNLPPNEIAGVYPPRNGHGPFQDSLPQIALGRRTLPWERALDPSHLLPPATRPSALDPPQPFGSIPWMALLVFEETECTVYPQLPLAQVVPGDAFARLGAPANVFCDAVEAPISLVSAIMPSLEEIQILTHVRQVNVDDRELSAGDSDGWFAVVMSNRLPRSGAKHVACLVSLEERIDVVAASASTQFEDLSDLPLFTEYELAEARIDLKHEEHEEREVALDAARNVLFGASLDEISNTGFIGTTTGGTSGTVGGSRAFTVDHAVFSDATIDAIFLDPVIRLVCLHRWTFECPSTGATFRDLTRGLDVAMIGTTAVIGQPIVTDTGHIPVTIHDRGGITDLAWYRGPLSPYQLTRDPLGPYHSADQCRRVTPETGAEDISYAAAFEIGRLLAAADLRLAQELMRWRRRAYARGGRQRTIDALVEEAPNMLFDDLREHLAQALVPIVSNGVVPRIGRNLGPIADPYGIDDVRGAPGLDPAQVRSAWNLPSTELARAVLGFDAAFLDREPRQITIDRYVPMTTFDEVVEDRDGARALAQERADLLERAAARVEQIAARRKGR